MADWRASLSHLLRSAAPAGRPRAMPDEAPKLLEAFVGGTVLPAFEELAAELREHGREARIERGVQEATLTVVRGGREEFRYSVRARAYHRMSFAFPEHADDAEPRDLRVEVELSSGARRSAPLDELTRERLIEDFLRSYSRWIGWA